MSGFPPASATEADKAALTLPPSHAPDEKGSAEVAEPHVSPGDDGTDLTDGLERWNSPKVNTYRFCAANLSLLIMGMNDACIGVGHEWS